MKILKTVLIVLAVLLFGLAVFLYKGEIPADVVDAKYTNDASKFLELENGARVHYRDEGNPNGAPVVLVHGSNASLHTWEPWVAELGSTYRVVTMDLPAHGLTGAVPDGDYSSEGQVKTVAAVAEHLGLEQFALGGNSMGGGVTWRYTLKYPEQVTAMLLINSSGLPAWWQERLKEQEADGREAPIAFKLLGQPWFRAVSKYLDPYYMVEQGVRSAYNNSPVVNQELIDRYYELSIREGTRDATINRFANRPNFDQTFDLSALTQPTLVMWGTEDALIPVSTADKFAEVLPNTTVVIYEEVGHAPMEEIPERSAQDILKFLAGLDLPETKTGEESPVNEDTLKAGLIDLR